MPEPGRETRRPARRQKGTAEARRRYILEALERPRTQAELRDALGMSNSGILHLLRRMEHDGLVRPAERVCRTRIWERVGKSASRRRALRTNDGFQNQMERVKKKSNEGEIAVVYKDFEDWLLEEIRLAEETSQAIKAGTLWVGSELNPSASKIGRMAQDYKEKADRLRGMLNRLSPK